MTQNLRNITRLAWRTSFHLLRRFPLRIQGVHLEELWGPQPLSSKLYKTVSAMWQRSISNKDTKLTKNCNKNKVTNNWDVIYVTQRRRASPGIISLRRSTCLKLWISRVNPIRWKNSEWLDPGQTLICLSHSERRHNFLRLCKKSDP